MARNTLSPKSLLIFLTCLGSTFQPIHSFTGCAKHLTGTSTTKRHVVGLLSRAPSVISTPRTASTPPFRNNVRLQGITFTCRPSRPVLQSISLQMRPKRRITVIKPSNDNGSALTDLVLQLCSPSHNLVYVSKISVQSCARTSLQSRVDIILRSDLLFTTAVNRGVTCNGPGTATTSVHLTTRLTGTRRFVRHLPRNCSALINRQKIALSNNRHRHVSVTHTTIHRSPVLLLSRPAAKLSGSGRHAMVRTLRQITRHSAALVVARSLALTTGTSRVVCVRQNRVLRHNARPSLVRHRKTCTTLCRVRVTRKGKAVPLIRNVTGLWSTAPHYFEATLFYHFHRRLCRI